MLRSLVRFVCITIVQFFHRQIGIRGHRAPEEGPVLIVANHPNGLIDPMLIRIVLRREVGFMAKAPLFENPFGKLAMEAFAAVPVYRAKDGKDTSANEKTFDAVRRRFEEGRWVVIFPEGHSHSEPALQKLKTGAARIALSFESSHGFSGKLQILPVGLIYEDKERFRSRVAIVVGDPIHLAKYEQKHAKDEWSAVTELTEEIADALARVVLEAETDEIWHGFLAVARWTTPDAVDDIARCEERARTLADAYRRLMYHSPEQAEELAEEARRFVRMLEAIGVEDPYSLESPRPPSLGAIVMNVASYVVLLPIALLGWALNALPYYGIAPLAHRVAGNDNDIVSSVKALAGLLFYPLTWLIEAAAALYVLGNWGWALAVFAAGPATGLVAVHYFEQILLRRDALVGAWLRFTRKNVVESVTTRRAELAARIEAALAEVLEPKSARAE